MKKILMSLFTIAVIGALITGGAFAVFTNTEQVGGNTFTTGTVDLTVTGGGPLTFSNMAPGDSTFGTITVTNSGTLELRYAMTTTVDSGAYLAGQLCLVIAASITDIPYGPGLLPLNAGFFGNPAQGSDPGDRVLAAGAVEVFTFAVLLPLNTGSGWQGTSCTVTFNFIAEQTVNNP